MSIFYLDTMWSSTAFDICSNSICLSIATQRGKKKKKKKKKELLDTASCLFSSFIRMFGMHILEAFILGLGVMQPS